jgi:hypothetical protein
MGIRWLLLRSRKCIIWLPRECDQPLAGPMPDWSSRSACAQHCSGGGNGVLQACATATFDGVRCGGMVQAGAASGAERVGPCAWDRHIAWDVGGVFIKGSLVSATLAHTWFLRQA